MRQTRCISLSMFNVLGVDQTAYLRLNVQHNDCGWRVHYAEIDSGTHVTNCYKICSRVVAMVLDRGDLGVYISNISQGSSDVFPPQWRNYEGGGGTVKHVLPLGCPAPPSIPDLGGKVPQWHDLFTVFIGVGKILFKSSVEDSFQKFVKKHPNMLKIG